MDWLIMRDALNTACNIASATFKGEGQTGVHSSPDHITRRTDVKWNSLGPQATLLMHPVAPQDLCWSSMVYR